jgi:LmbE family N-acetylglucosaminyl deacetylase
MSLPDSEVERALVVVAHPDDADFAASGTVAAWVAAGISVSYCLITDGDAGGFDPSVDRSEIPAIRQAEQRAAAAELGVTDVHFLGHPDGALTLTMDLRRDISRVIRQVRPQRLITQSPTRNWERLYASHPDHLLAGEATLCAVYPDARNPFAHPQLLADEGLEPWTVAEVWMMGGPADQQNRYVDVTDKLERKVAALRAHVSQTAHMDDIEGLLRTWMGSQAYRAGYEPGRLAEAYHVIDTQG